MNSKTVIPQDIFILIILIWEELSLKIITENIFSLYTLSNRVNICV